MERKPYHQYSVEELATDAYFRAWVLQPTEELDEFWQSFLLKHPEKSMTVKNAARLLKAVQQHFKEKETDLSQLHTYYDEVEKRASTSKPETGRTLTTNFLVRAAAAAALIILAGLAFLLMQDGSPMQVYQTAFGEQLKTTLPDGSLVILNANSSLTYDKEWKKGKDRVVRLNGEAHFTVTPQPATQAKFSVVTNDLKVHVLGTIFNVRARENGTRVTLEEGKITLDLRETMKQLRTIEMLPGEQVHFSAQTRELQETKVDVAIQSAWKEGVIIFDGASMQEIGTTITETFGWKVEFRDKASREETVTGAGPANNLGLLIENLRQATDMDIVMNEKEKLLIFE